MEIRRNRTRRCTARRIALALTTASSGRQRVQCGMQFTDHSSPDNHSEDERATHSNEKNKATSPRVPLQLLRCSQRQNRCSVCDPQQMR
eukprot:88615-Lingulodinium_polyedra.AAC.1